MPASLPQLPRREFLKRLALAGAAAVAPSAYAGLFGKSRDKDTFFFYRTLISPAIRRKPISRST